jgi:fructose-specific phosphotransferase system component IIB
LNRAEELEQSHLQIANAIYKAANEALSKAQKERRKEWWTHDIKPLIKDKKRAYNKCLMTKNVEYRERYKRQILKERSKRKRIEYEK